MPTPSEKLRDRWLDAMLPLAATRGWNTVTAKQAAREAEVSTDEQALAAPNGVNDLIDHFFDRAVNETLVQLAQSDLSALRTHERVAMGLKTWLEKLTPHKAAVGKAAAQGLLPWAAGAATRRIWRIADAIWEAAGDTATDYNRQTKRALLSAVIPPIVLYWLDHEDPEKVDAFIARRLSGAMKIGQFGGRVIGPILDLASRVRARNL
ncbi:MAG: COQ9 family protein [Pseudomonadota bacterium]